MSKRILLVDNNLAVQKMVEITLGKEGYLVACADNSLSALDMALKSRPDLILADSQLQGMRFEAFSQKLRHKERLNDIPLILMVHDNDIIDERRLKSAGITDFLKKPIDPAELIQKIRRQMEDRETVVMDTVAMNLQGPSTIEQNIPSPSEDEEEKLKEMEEMLGWSRPADVQFEEAPSPQAESAPSPPGPTTSAFEEEAMEDTLFFSTLGPPPSEASAAESPPPPSAEPGDAGETLFNLAEDLPAPDPAPPPPPAADPGMTQAYQGNGLPQQAEALSREMVEKIVRDIVEQVVWEVVPPLAESEIKKAVDRLQKEI